MDFVPISYSREQKRRTRNLLFGWVGTSAAAVAQLPVLAVAGIFSSAADAGVYFVSIAVAMGGLLGVLVSATSIPSDGRHIRMLNRRDSIREALNEHYGLDLTLAQFEALKYPENDPGPGFQTFGSIKVQDQLDGVNFVERTIYLTASDGELKLTDSRDGKRFKELKPARHAVEGSTSSPRTALESPRNTIEAQATPLSVSV